MPMFIGLLVVLALFYQLCFRYETHESDKQTGVTIERDTLTGDERVLKAGAKVSVMARILGSRDRSSAEGNSSLIQPWGEEGSATTAATTATEQPSKRLEPIRPQEAAYDTTTTAVPLDYHDTQQMEKIARPVAVPREVIIASSAPPVPIAAITDSTSKADAEEAMQPFAIRQIDLNKDGSTEEIIQNATQPDGLLDISIVKNGKEIFFGRGKQIALLPSRTGGWSDIVLKMGAKTLQIFRYNPKDAAYRVFDQKS
jgi:hypothetical protein